MNRLALTNLALATALLALPGSALAKSSSSTGNMSGLHLTAADAQLDHSLNSAKAMQGQIVTAKLKTSIKAANGVDLPSGTELEGRVNKVRQSAGNREAMLSLTFNQARLKDGRVVPIKATLLGIYPQGSSDSNLLMKVAPDQQIDQEPGVIGHISLHSAVKSTNSGTLMSSNDKNFQLRQGTELQIAIAPRSTGNNASSGA